MKPHSSIQPVNWVKPFIYGLLLIGIYYSTYSWLIVVDWSRDDYSASYLIPFVFLYLLWEKRDTFLQTESFPSWTGLWIFGLGILLFWIGELSGEYFSLYISSWLILVGICWMHLGWPKLKKFGFAFLVLLAMFPLPHFLYDRVSFQLKLISSRLGVWAMQAFGMSAYREGNIIDLGFTQLQIVDACSGLRYLIPLIVLGILVAYFFKGALWKRVLVVISTVPIAIFVNGMRVASVGILYQYFGPAIAEGFFHDFSAWLIFMVSFLMLLGVAAILRPVGRKRSVETGSAPPEGIEAEGSELESLAPKADMGGRKEVGDAGGSQNPKSVKQHPTSKTKNADPLTWRNWIMPPQSVVALGLLGLTLVFSQGVEFRETVPVRKPFTEFPKTIEQWRGESQTLQQIFIDQLDFTDYILVNYKDSNDRFVNLYVAYYESQRKGESIHSPATCLPGSGWQFKTAGTAVLQPSRPDMPQMIVRRAVVQNKDSRMLSYFWFPMRGRILHNAYQMKLYNFWDALTMKQTNGALVRLITPVYEDERIADAEQRLQTFSKAVVPTLSDFLP